MNVEDLVQQRIAEAARRREASKERRADLQAARDAGLVQRHRGKLARLNAAEIASARPTGSYALSTAEPAAGCAPEGRRLQAPSTPGGTTVPPNARMIICPACRVERMARRVAAVVIAGAPHDAVRCLDPACELLWLVRADRPRVAPVAA
ncbi:hypothetical protein [Actinacidiphila oryziradicis]|uniref:Uncharacterized protein n=1 Tax=Actinacidiphila oryziradicis TaxID=2571141 RepID=A0A4U0SPA8_9ACTN|nr:hypothetical protein [Actinacidiphila oryziradicis]TKA11742.1 hypothetical protein FCI23_10455 [Actinacidiphila oryziradicis]